MQKKGIFTTVLFMTMALFAFVFNYIYAVVICNDSLQE